jgi:serine/threonine protein kinase
MAERRLPRGTDSKGLLLADLADGTRLGEFVIERKLGSRGTGHLYQATHLVLPRRATITVLPAAEGALRSVALELIREACIVDAVDHPGMPRVFECGMLPDRRPWIATELIEGKTVAHLLESGNVSLADVIAIVRDVADILAESHRRGLVHCHVEPASIVIPAYARRFRLCLVDWVGARTHDSSVPLPLVVGSAYVSPEQVSATAADDRSDVYALGKIGRDLLQCVLGEDVPPMFIALLESMIVADRTARPSSAEVRNTAAWLAMEHAEEATAAIPEPTSETTQRSAPITSEIATAVTGEINPRT